MQGGHATGAAVKDVRAEAWSKWPQEKGGGKAKERRSGAAHERGCAQRIMIAGFHNLDSTLIRLESQYFVNPVMADEIRLHLFIDVCKNTNTAANTGSQEGVCHVSCEMNPFLSPLDELEKGF